MAGQTNAPSPGRGRRSSDHGFSLNRWRAVEGVLSPAAARKAAVAMAGAADRRAETSPSRRRASIARDAATAVAWGDKPPPRGLRLISFRPLVKNSLCGFVNVEPEGAGLLLHDIAVHVSRNGKSWVAPPAAPIIDAEGRHHVVDGKKQYRPRIEWVDRERSDRFSERVIALLLERYPDALAPEAAA